MTMNLLFVDSRVTQYQQIVDSVNANTQCVVFDFHSDSFASLLAKCDKPSYNSIGLLQHNDHLPHFQMLSSMSPALLGNNNDFSSWNQFRDFITSLKKQKNIQNFDMMACALYSDPSWKAVLDYVENVTGVNIHASFDDTGSTALGGNWFLETDDVNLKTVYFTDAIDKYDGLLGSNASNSGFITTNNTLYVWGSNGSGQLSSLSNPTTVPTLFPNISNVKMVSFGGAHILILKTDGSVVACGSNSSGQLGDGSTTARSTPVQVLAVNGVAGVGPYLTNIVSISAGWNHSMFLASDGSVVACGYNFYTQLGDGSNTNRTTPVQVKNVGGTGFLSNIVSIYAGFLYSLFLAYDGSVVACGWNLYGQLGDGSTTIRSTPVQVLAVNGVAGVGPYLSNIVSISAGQYHSMFLASNGSVVACGFNWSGQLGDGSTTARSTPVPVLAVNGVAGVGPYISNIVSISAGYLHSLFLASDGSVIATGYNVNGQLGDGTTTQRNSPVQVKNVGGTGFLSNIAKISAGYYHSMFLASDGSVVACGSNSSGQLGDGTTTNRSTPVVVNTSVTNIKVLNDAPDPQSIITNFVLPYSTRTYGDPPFSITDPTSNSTGAFTYSSSNTSVATVSGNTITIVGAGTTTITATQAGVLGINSITSVNTILTVNGIANPTITNFPTITKYRYDIPFLLTLPSSNSNGSFTYSSSDTSIATVSGATVTILNIGTTTITATQGPSGMYNGGSITCTLTIIPSIDPTITNFPTITKNGNESPFTLTPPSSNSSGSFTYSSSNTSIATVSGATVTFVSYGTTTITATQAPSGMYNGGSITCTLTINPLTPTLSVPSGNSLSIISNSDFNNYDFVNGMTSLYSNIDDASYGIPMPNSNFKVNNAIYNTLYVCTNGTLSFNTDYGRIGYGITQGALNTFQFFMNDLVSTCSYKFVNNNTVLLLLFTGRWYSGSYAGQTYSIKFIISQNNSIQVYYESINASSAPVGIAYIGNNSGSTSDDTFLTINGVTFNNISNQYGLLVGKTILLSYTEGGFTIPTKKDNNAPFSLPTVVSNSGGAITYSSSNNNVATITGSTVTIVGSGTSTITATSAANGVYTSGSITTLLTVNSSVLTIQAWSIASKTFGDAAFAITAPSSNSNGLFSYSSSNTSVATVSGSNITIVGAGNTTITATQAATSDYSSGSVTANLVVAKANPIIQAWSLASKTFGDAAFAITAPSSNSNGLFSYSSSNNNVATVSGSNINIVAAGSTTITATQAATTNYNEASVTATLVVAKANPTINLVLQNTSNVILTNYNAVSYIKNKIPKDDILNLIVNSNSPGLISYGSNNTTIASISSVGLIRRRDYGNVRFTVSQPETSNYNSKTVHLNITIVPQASYGNRPNFLLGL